MPATFLLPDCMAVCIPADQNETFIVANDDVVVLDDEGLESLLPPDSNKSNQPFSSALEFSEPLPLLPLPPPPSVSTPTELKITSSVGAPLFAIREIESEDLEEACDDSHDDNDGREEAVLWNHAHLEDDGVLSHDDDGGDYHHYDEQFCAPEYARTVPEDIVGNSETAMLFREMLQLGPSEHVAFSGTDSHQYLFQHFDAENLEFEEAAAVRPKFIGHYLLGDCLGEGSYAKVKEALNTETLERTAVKIFSPVKLKRIPNGMANVFKEVNILRKLDHPNVCRMKELLKKELKKKLYLIMDYAVCAISDLTKSLAHERLPAWKAHYYFLHVLDGLQYCHSRGVIHKDLKPSNLVITTKDTLKIIDFGVAEQLSPYAADDIISSSQGCPAVQPPQVADGTEFFSGIKLDVWSCGVTFFSLCAGNSRFPFVGETVYELFANICEKTPDMAEDLRREEPEFCSLIDVMLEKNESNRPTVDQLRSHPWVRRHWPMPPAGQVSQEYIEKALLRSTDSFVPYIQAYYHSSNRTSTAGSICCMTGGKVPHHHHHCKDYPRCHSHHLSQHNSSRRVCRQGSEYRRRSSADSRHTLTHNASILSRDLEQFSAAQESTAADTTSTTTAATDERRPRTRNHNHRQSDQGCFSFKKWKICRVS